jgi:NitT/TauT family transport system ATP-binding protein
MTFPFSNHNYQLRFWMAAAGIDPDEDVRLVVLPPPFMVDSLASGHVDGFCVGAPWNQVAVDASIGHILHFGCDLQARLTEKVLAVRGSWAAQESDSLRALLRALQRAAAFVADAANAGEVALMLAAPHRIGVDAQLMRRILEGRIKVAPDGTIRSHHDYLLIGRDNVDRPDPVHAAWLYAQMVRWKQAPLLKDALTAAKAVFRPDLYDAALETRATPEPHAPKDHIGAFAGPPFDADNIAAHVAGPGR